MFHHIFTSINRRFIRIFNYFFVSVFCIIISLIRFSFKTTFIRSTFNNIFIFRSIFILTLCRRISYIFLFTITWTDKRNIQFLFFECFLIILILSYNYFIYIYRFSISIFFVNIRIPGAIYLLFP